MRTVISALGVMVMAMAIAGVAAAQTPPKMNMSKLDIMLMKPSTAKTGGNQFEVMVKDAGRPVDKADVSLVFVMLKTATMAEMRNTVKLKAIGDGMYSGEGNVMMSGTWNVTIDVMQNGKSLGEKKVTLTAK